MKQFFLILACFVVSSAAFVHAANMDITDPTCNEANVENCPNPIFNNTFTFTSSQNGGGIVTFTNLSQDLFKSFIMSVPILLQPQDFFCQSDVFNTCNATIDPTNTFTILRFFNDPANGSGIPYRSEFTINLNNDFSLEGDTGGWGSNTTFFAAANTDIPPSIPEPATLTLLGAGIAGVVVRRLKRRS